MEDHFLLLQKFAKRCSRFWRYWRWKTDIKPPYRYL